MKIENQCCTLDQAKDLSKLGISQHSLFYWCFTSNGADADTSCEFDDNAERWITRRRINKKNAYRNSAFTVAELGCMLNGAEHYLPYFTGNIWQRATRKKQYSNITIVGKTEAEARAAMLIYLLENNLITADEVNQSTLNETTY